MTRFYAQGGDEEQLMAAAGDHQSMTVTGLTFDGKVRAFTGRVLSLDNGETPYPEYPLTVKMDEAANEGGSAKPAGEL